MIDYLKIENEVYPIRFSYKVITKHMAKLGLKKFVDLERFVNEMPADSMVNFLHDAITAGCAKLDQKPPKVDWLEENLDFAHVSEALEIFGKQMGGGKQGQDVGNEK